MVRLATLEGVGRLSTIYRPHPPSKVLVMSKRLPMWYFREQKWGAGNTYAHMWLIWDRADTSGQTKLVWR